VPFRLGLYPVVDSVEWIKRLLEAGVRTIQLRIKDKRDEEVEADVVAAIELGHRYDARLFINDYWQLAIKHKAYGVHLGQEDLETTDLRAIRQADLRLASRRTTIWKLISHWTPAHPISHSVTSFRHKPNRCRQPLRGWCNWLAISSVWRITLLSPSAGSARTRFAVLATGVGSIAVVSHNPRLPTGKPRQHSS
jgi:hypothetical protein